VPIQQLVSMRHYFDVQKEMHLAAIWLVQS